MSRWQAQFENPPFQVIWNDIISKSEVLTVDDESVITNIEAVTHL